MERFTRRWPEACASGVGHRDQARLIDLRVGEAEDVRCLFFEEQMPGGPDRAEATGPGGEHEAPPGLGNRAPHAALQKCYACCVPEKCCVTFDAAAGADNARDDVHWRLLHVIGKVL